MTSSTVPTVSASKHSRAPLPGRAGLPTRLIRAPEFGAAVAAIALYVFFTVTAAGNGFATAVGTASWLNTASELGIIAVPVGLLMMAGDFDLSIGSMVGAGSITVGVVSGYFHQPLVYSLAIALGIALIVGMGNGLLVTLTKLPSFIVTLGANLVIAGLALTVSRAFAGTTQISVASADDPLAGVFNQRVGSFNISIVWWLLVLIIATWMLGATRFGNAVLATGGDAEKARRSGVLTSRVKISLFVCTALAAVFVGVLQAVEFSTGDATTGQGYVFQAPIVVVIGGVLLTGGYGTILGVALGTVIYGIINAGLFYTGWNTDYSQVVIGLLMIVAVLTNNFLRRLAMTSIRTIRRR